MSETNKRDEAQIMKDMQYSPSQATALYQQESRAAQKAGSRATNIAPSPMEEKLPLSAEELEKRKRASKRVY